MKAIECLEHLSTAGERWDTLAWRYYGDPYAYARIIAANPAINIGTTLPSAQIILIPLMLLDHLKQIAVNFAEELPPWKR